jgi:hypothetical protein
VLRGASAPVLLVRAGAPAGVPAAAPAVRSGAGCPLAPVPA